MLHLCKGGLWVDATLRLELGAQRLSFDTQYI